MPNRVLAKVGKDGFPNIVQLHTNAQKGVWLVSEAIFVRSRLFHIIGGGGEAATVQHCPHATHAYVCVCFQPVRTLYYAEKHMYLRKHSRYESATPRALMQERIVYLSDETPRVHKLSAF